MADNKDVAAKLAADARDAAKARDEQLAAERKAADADTKAYYDRLDGLQPTPTQEENDRAKLGISSLADLDNKEDDGAPSEAEARVAAAEAAVAREKAAAKK